MLYTGFVSDFKKNNLKLAQTIAENWDDFNPSKA